MKTWWREREQEIIKRVGSCYQWGAHWYWDAVLEQAWADSLSLGINAKEDGNKVIIP